MSTQVWNLKTFIHLSFSQPTGDYHDNMSRAELNKPLKSNLDKQVVGNIFIHLHTKLVLHQT